MYKHFFKKITLSLFVIFASASNASVHNLVAWNRFFSIVERKQCSFAKIFMTEKNVQISVGGAVMKVWVTDLYKNYFDVNADLWIQKAKVKLQQSCIFIGKLSFKFNVAAIVWLKHVYYKIGIFNFDINAV